MNSDEKTVRFNNSQLTSVIQRVIEVLKEIDLSKDQQLWREIKLHFNSKDTPILNSCISCIRGPIEEHEKLFQIKMNSNYKKNDIGDEIKQESMDIQHKLAVENIADQSLTKIIERSKTAHCNISNQGTFISTRME